MQDEQHWVSLGGNLVSGFFPVTIKAFYVYGLILSIFNSTQLLVQSSKSQGLGRRLSTNFPRYFAAFALCASAIELFGRCLGGIAVADGQVSRCLRIGFNWLASPGQINEANDSIVVVTTRHSYTVANLIMLRNFTAHGQATTSRLEQPFIDTDLLHDFPILMETAMETWWFQITSTNRTLCENLAQANVLPISLDQPVNATALSFSVDAAGNPFSRLDFS